MKRLDFIKNGIGVLVGFSFLSGFTRKKMTLYEGYLAAFPYYEASRLEKFLQVDDALTLKREPENNYDSRAIAVYWKRHKLGYIKKGDNQTLSRLLDAKATVVAQISKLEPTEPTWHRISVKVVG